MQPSATSLTRQLVLGLVIGAAISVLPIELAFLSACAALIFLLKRHYWATIAITVLLCISATLLPLKRLDRTVAPFSYSPMALGELAAKLRDDQNIPVFAIHSGLQSNIVALSVTEPMTRREVIAQLAAQTGSRPRFRTCSSGATLLFGCSTVAFLEVPTPAASTPR